MTRGKGLLDMVKCWHEKPFSGGFFGVESGHFFGKDVNFVGFVKFLLMLNAFGVWEALKDLMTVVVFIFLRGDEGKWQNIRIKYCMGKRDIYRPLIRVFLISEMGTTMTRGQGFALYKKWVRWWHVDSGFVLSCLDIRKGTNNYYIWTF